MLLIKIISLTSVLSNFTRKSIVGILEIFSTYTAACIPLSFSNVIKPITFQCKLPTVEECMQLAEAALADGNIFETVKYFLLSQEPEKALPVGIDFIKGKFSVGGINSNLLTDLSLSSVLTSSLKVRHQPS